ncbi:hypothetical protein BpHYR1_015094 [Brachionus plicatilis]|uniref:Uncharacterized protein n=1 Tax=Brachionus plicatilis TaxID=10195 RepID=A0A3M7PK24_BRAPC|nr:hypothetical protein BpHYR1_015094 [Brachionus plicatilis]
MYKLTKNFKLKMGRLQRAKSVPNVSLSQVMSHMSGIYDDDLYPITPQLQLRHQINLPSIFNNINLNETSQLITNL